MKLENLDDEDKSLNDVDEEFRNKEFEWLHIVYSVERDKVLIGNGIMSETERKVRDIGKDEWRTQKLLTHFQLPRVMGVKEVKEWKQEQLQDEESELSKVVEKVKERNDLD